MIDIQKIAEQSGMTQYVAAENKYLEKFAALYREAVVQELVKEAGEPQIIGVAGFCDDGVGYTADQLAGAVLRERERCAKVCESFNSEPMSHASVAAAIRSGDATT